MATFCCTSAYFTDHDASSEVASTPKAASSEARVAEPPKPFAATGDERWARSTTSRMKNRAPPSACSSVWFVASTMFLVMRWNAANHRADPGLDRLIGEVKH